MNKNLEFFRFLESLRSKLRPSITTSQNTSIKLRRCQNMSQAYVEVSLSLTMKTNCGIFSQNEIFNQKSL